MIVDDVDMPSWLEGVKCKRCSHSFQSHRFYAFQQEEDTVIHANCKYDHCRCSSISIEDGQVIYD